MVFYASGQVAVMVVVAVANTLTNVLRTLDHRFFSCIACCTHMAKVQIDEPCEKKQVLVSRSFLDQELCYFDTTNPGGKRVFWAHVVARVQGPGCGTCSRPRSWDMFGIQLIISLSISLGR